MTEDSDAGEYDQVNFQARKRLIRRADKQAEKDRTNRSAIIRKALDEYCGSMEEFKGEN